MVPHPTAPDYSQPELVLRDFISALEMFKLEQLPLDQRTGERSIAFRLGLHLQYVFKYQNVDAEYDRNIEDHKRISNLYEIRFTDFEIREIRQIMPKVLESKLEIPDNRVDEGDRIYPDLIVHHRHRNDGNILVIEVKKPGGVPSAIHKDLLKLKGFTEVGYRYVLGIFLELSPTGSRWLAFTEGTLNRALSSWPQVRPRRE